MLTEIEIMDTLTYDGNVEVDTDESMRIINRLMKMQKLKAQSPVLPLNVDIKDLKELRNYFGEHDKTIFEHRAFEIIDKLVTLFENGEWVSFLKKKPTTPGTYKVMLPGGNKTTYNYTGSEMSMICMSDFYEAWFEVLEPTKTPQ